MYLQVGAALLHLFNCLLFCCSGKVIRAGSENEDLGLQNSRVSQAENLKCEYFFIFSLPLAFSANYFSLQSRGHDSPWRVAAHFLAFVCTEPSSVVMTPGPCIVRTLGLRGLDLNITFFLKRCTVRDPQADCSSGLAWPQNI